MHKPMQSHLGEGCTQTPPTPISEGVESIPHLTSFNHNGQSLFESPEPLLHMANESYIKEVRGILRCKTFCS